MTKLLAGSDVPKLIKLLAKRGKVFVPQKEGGETVFAPASEDSKLALNYETTALPPKYLFLPPEEELLTVKSGKVVETPAPDPFIIFGISLKDLAAICQLDEIMSKEPLDSFYHKRREKAVLIAVTNSEIGTPPGGDLILEKTEDNYRAVPLTISGKKVVDLPVFKSEGGSGGRESGERQAKPTKLEEMLLDCELLARVAEWSRTGCPEIWERLGKQCLGCGICTYICPLCYCFTTEDRVGLDGTTCTRCRWWDACTLPDFATVAGGFNFRKTLKDRYYNWFYHKFVRAYKEFGRAQCVACGRCQKYCPAGIDIEKVLEEIVERFKEANPERKF